MTSIIFAKLDPGFFGNRKIIRAGRNGREVCLFALCGNAARGALGSIPAADLEPWYVAHQLGIPEFDAAEGLQRAVTADLLELRGSSYVIRGWDDEWSRRAKTGAERAATYRDRHGAVVTSNGQSDASRIREERSEKRDQSTSDSLDLPLPKDWAPNNEHRRTGAVLGVDVESEAADLRVYSVSKGWKRKDWDAAFTRWMKQSERRKTPKQQRQAGTVKARTFDSTGREIELEHEPDDE